MQNGKICTIICIKNYENDRFFLENEEILAGCVRRDSVPTEISPQGAKKVRGRFLDLGGNPNGGLANGFSAQKAPIGPKDPFGGISATSPRL